MSRIVVASLTSLALAVASSSAQLVFEPQLTGSPLGETYSPRLALGDVDGDGDLDAVVATGADSLFFAYEILLNDGTGALARAGSVPVSPGIKGLSLADLDGDLVLDLVTAQGDAIRLRRGLGDGSFGPPELVYSPATPNVCGLELLELNGDAALDLVALQDGQVVVLAGLGDGSFGAPSPVADLAAQVAYGARAADLDGDGAIDLVVLARDASVPGSPACFAHVLRATGTGGTGAFNALGSHALGSNADLELVSLDADELTDMACSSTLGLVLWRGLGTGDFLPGVAIASERCDTGLAAADFDGDGDTDLASVQPASGELVFWQGDEEGGFAEGLRVSGADPYGVEGELPFAVRPLIAADMNGDDRPDLVRTAGDTFGQVQVSAFCNHTYAADAAFLDLGHALSDPGWLAPADLEMPGMLLATPILLADGTLQAGSEVRLRVLRQGVESDRAWLIVGLQDLFAPLFGGTLVPSPDFIIGPLLLPSFHSVADLHATMPGVPAGFEFWIQAWFTPTASGQDFAATNAVRATAP